jgi:NAD(P)-dependent dehydrogenase (short-subunit alcohol dehydrogenase family)
MFEDLQGRVALVTGASSGLGRHFAMVLAGQGAKVVLAARRRAALEETCSAIAAQGGTALALAMDVSDAASVREAFGRLGEAPDLVVNNAGVTDPRPALEIDAEEWRRVMATNLDGAFFVAQAAAKAMIAAGKRGAIINIASILGLRVAGNVSSYTASKAALIQLTRALALEWARYGIRVNVLCPGYVETDLNRDFFATEAGQALIRRIPQRRLGRPDDLDGALLLLASDAGSYITGAVLAADGGHLVSSL